MNRSTNAAKYAAIIMSLIVTVTMVSGCKKNNTDVSLLRRQQKQKAQSRQEAILKGIQNRLKQMQGRRRRRIHI